MQVVILIIGGIAAGFVATRLLRLETDLLTTAAIGVLGSVAGVFAIRFLFVAVTYLGVIAAALAGAVVLSWLYRSYIARP
ncbi:MAG: GlsB/YeaQ/YmgE family stress response membrane protein [Rhodobacteraceae bacterium]|nr:GlsB/YeaQ/YmgE family stress response membrane protein [Paracoccaceae bacterium]